MAFLILDFGGLNLGGYYNWPINRKKTKIQDIKLKAVIKVAKELAG